MKRIIEKLKQGSRYILQLAHEDKDNELKLSLSVALGAFVGILPIWGFQLVASVALAYALKLNKPLVALFSNVSLPPLIPLILYGSLQLGSFILQGQFLALLPKEMSWQLCRDSFTFYIVGSFWLALFVGSTFGFSAYIFLKILKKYREKHA